MTPDLTEATIPTLSRAQLVSAQAKLSAEIAQKAAMALRINAELMRPDRDAAPDRLISTGEAARLLGVSRATLYAKREQSPWSTFFVASPGDVKCHAGRIAEYLRDPDGYGLQRGGAHR